MGTQGAGRKRSTKKERSTAEDDALNLIAREAEARLAAKRAARAEAREIRMKELERQQKELSDDDERMSVGSRGSVRVEDRDYLEKGSRAASALTAGTLTSLGGTSSRRGSGETALTLDADTSIREIKDALAEVEEKYRKAMVSNAQLDNEKNNLMYQVDTLKDSLMELEELLSESRREYEEKVKEFEREKYAHSVLQFQFNEMKETLKQSEELLNKHGIVLGPDLNINGDIGEAEVDGSSGGDATCQPTQDPQTSPTEGNSVLGNTEETQLRSNGEEEVDGKEQQEKLKEEAKKNQLSSDSLCNVADVPTLETLHEEQPTEEQQKSLPREDDSAGESGFSKDLNVDDNDHPGTEAKDMINSSPEIVTSVEENVIETETPENVNLEETSSLDLGETESKKPLEEQEKNQEDAEESNVCKEESPQQEVAKEVVQETETNSASSKLEPQQEADNTEEAENDETEEISSKPQAAAAASGKKKKKKKRGKKKGGNQNKDGAEKENGKKEEHDVESDKRDNGSTSEPLVEESVTETLKETKTEQVKEQDVNETKEVNAAQAEEPNESLHHKDESSAAHDTDEHDIEQSLTTETVEKRETVELSEIVSHTETPKEITEDVVVSEQKEEQSLSAERTDGCVTTNGEDYSELKVADGAKDEVFSAEETRAECTASNPETNSEDNTEAEQHVASNGDTTADQSESNDFEGTDVTTVVLPSTDDLTDHSPKTLSDSQSPLEPPSEPPVASNAQITDPVELTEVVKVEDEPGIESEQEHTPPGPDEAEKEELSGELRELEDLVKSDGCDRNTEQSQSEAEAHVEHVDDVESQTKCVEESNESNTKVSLETDETEPVTDSSKESTETDAAAAAQEPERQTSQNDEGNETSPCPLDKLHESSEDKSEDDRSQAIQQGSDEEDGEDEEGQSFDFDDMDIEAAVATDLPINEKREEVEEGVEVLSDGSNNDSSEPSQSHVETSEEKQTAAKENQGDAVDKGLNQDSSVHGEAAADEAKPTVEEGKDLNVTEPSVVVENLETSVQVEEGLDAVKHELNSADLVLPESTDQEAGSKEPPQSGKDAKKNGKKGKGKGKEECKMS